MNIAKAFGIVLLVLLLDPFARAQSTDRVQQTWRGPDVSTLWELLNDGGAKGVRVDVLKFTPAGDSGVTKALADAIGATPEERAAQAFAQLKQGYEAEVAREGKSNNLAAAMTFFIAANVMSYHHTEMASVTITPRTSKATLRDLNGVVQETRANTLEKITYKWNTHYFEGIGETNLVLQPPQATSRDGILGSNSLFPNAFLYTQGDKLEWRF